MSAIEVNVSPDRAAPAGAALEHGFPTVELSLLAEQESWRKELNRPAYHIHKWWATRLGSVFRAITLGALLESQQSIWAEFYRSHNFDGKVVLDPFMGSGTTIGEALKLGCKVVGCDINPISTFLVRQALARVQEFELRDGFELVERNVAAEIKRYYQTRSPVTGDPIPVLYFFWVKTVVAPDGTTIPLFDRLIFSQDAYPKRRPRAQAVCIDCWSIFEVTYDATEVACPACLRRFNPQIGPARGQYVETQAKQRYKVKDLLPRERAPDHKLYAIMALDAEGNKVYVKPTSEDEALYDEACTRVQREVLPLPTMEVRSGHNTDQARGYGYKLWSDFFNKRQLLCLGLLLKEILRLPNTTVREHLLCLFSSTLEFNNLFCSFKGHGTGAVRHMFSHHILKPERTPLENSIWGGPRTSGTFASLFESRLIKAKRYLLEPFEIALGSGDGSGKKSGRLLASPSINPSFADTWDALARTSGQAALLLNGDSAKLPLEDECIDAVITDPPYFDFVHYSELSDFFYAWLAPALHDRYSFFSRKDSSDPGEVQQKDPQEFAHQLARVLRECRRVLKRDGVLAFSFHHSRAEGWAAIASALVEAGLSVVAAHPVHAEQRGTSPKNAAQLPISLDVILVCKREAARESSLDDLSPAEKSVRVAESLQRSGYALSLNDQFVIAAGHAMVEVVAAGLSFSKAAERFEKIRIGCGSPVRAWREQEQLGRRSLRDDAGAF